MGSGASTIPGPPPKGVSSTDRCLSVAYVRRSWMRTSTTPCSRALPSRLTPKTGSSSCGKAVNTSILMSLRSSQLEQPLRRVDHDLPRRRLHDEGHGHEPL